MMNPKEGTGIVALVYIGICTVYLATAAIIAAVVVLIWKALS
jgi:hypothetical protein